MLRLRTLIVFKNKSDIEIKTHKISIKLEKIGFFFCADMRRDVQEIFRNTPHEKQVMMFSATLSKEIRTVCKKFMLDVNIKADYLYAGLMFNILL